MKLKSYLRGLGLGMIVTTLILVVAFKARSSEMTDAQIKERAYELGMIETSLYGSDTIVVDGDADETTGAAEGDSQTGEGGLQTEEGDSQSAAGIDETSSGALQTETTSAAKETTAAAKETTSAAKETTSAAKETTSAAKETTSAAKETTSAAKETTSAAKETTSAAKETTSATKATEKATEKATGTSVVLLFENINTATKASQILYDAGLIDSVEDFNSYLSENGLAAKVREGNFTFTQGMSYDEIATIIAR